MPIFFTVAKAIIQKNQIIAFILKWQVLTYDLAWYMPQKTVVIIISNFNEFSYKKNNLNGNGAKDCTYINYIIVFIAV